MGTNRNIIIYLFLFYFFFSQLLFSVFCPSSMSMTSNISVALHKEDNYVSSAWYVQEPHHLLALRSRWHTLLDIIIITS